MRVAVLCVARDSVYKTLPDVDAYDAERDARTFAGGMPIVAHPPCRAWSAFCAHQAKPALGERELGIWCAEQLRKCGGVLEQPAHSRLFDAAKLPRPGDKSEVGHARGDLWTISVDQLWWGYPTKKGTWLCMSGIDRQSIDLPYKLRPQGFDRRRFAVMSKHQRSHTVEPFARWLVDAARKAA